MRIAVFSDIHGNKEALKAIIDDIKNNNIDEVICLGDVIGIGPNPKECVDILIDNNIKTVLGNHDLYYLKGTNIDDEMGESEIKHHFWVKSQLTDREKDYLSKCNMYMELNANNKKMLFEHFLIDYNSKDEYPFQDLKIVNDGTINSIVETLDYDYIFIGHEHNAFVVDNKLYDVGTSGCTKDNITRYTIIDTTNFSIETKTIEYDRESFEKELLKQDYPDRNILAKWFFEIEL